jgi:hypothetical protein
VDYLEAMSGCAGTEVMSLDESDFQSTQRRFTGSGGACGSTADDDEVELCACQLCKVSMHRFFFRRWQRQPMHRARNVPVSAA